MSYRKDTIYEPFTMDDSNDMWVGTISYFPHDKNSCEIPHEECIEVRADTEILLNSRISVIVDALNSPTGIPI